MSQDEFGNVAPQDEDLGIGLKIVSFCIPIVGAILYFVYKKDEPKKSKQACYAALIGAGVGIVINILLTVLGIGASAMGG